LYYVPKGACPQGCCGPPKPPPHERFDAVDIVFIEQKKRHAHKTNKQNDGQNVEQQGFDVFPFEPSNEKHFGEKNTKLSLLPFSVCANITQTTVAGTLNVVKQAMNTERRESPLITTENTPAATATKQIVKQFLSQEEIRFSSLIMLNDLI
jgi:hypothetical protein